MKPGPEPASLLHDRRQDGANVSGKQSTFDIESIRGTGGCQTRKKGTWHGAKFPPGIATLPKAVFEPERAGSE
jgi:hypothetical protein